MKTALAVAGFTATALAAPSTLRDRVARRGVFAHESAPMIPSLGEDGAPLTNATTQVSYSDNWAGVVQTAPPAGTTFSAISATFNIPAVSEPSGGSGTHAASAWVGIDGDTYQKAILQSGCDFTVSGGSESYECWYEWYPNPLTYISAFKVAQGDEVTVDIVATSPSHGSTTLTNSRTGQKVTKSFSAPSASSTLGGKNAEWILEDFEEGGGLVPFAKFGKVTFTGCDAKAGSNNVGTNGGTVLDIRQNNKVLTSVDVISNTELSVSYV